MRAACWLLLIIVFAQLCSRLESRVEEGFTTGRIVSSELEDFSQSQEDLEQFKALLKQTTNSSTSGNSTVTATRQPCQCGGGVCGCCSRIVYGQKACVNVSYDPDEFSFTAKIMMNDRVLYTRTVSGKNPRPICVPVPRLPIRACVRFYNIYFQGRNIHLLCVNFTYQRNGLNVDVTLSSDTISTRTVTNFKAFQFCVYVPGCLFSTASITACLRLDIYAKKQLWQINYDCISISMMLPIIPTNNTVRMTDTDVIAETSTAESSQSSMTEPMTAMPSSEMAIVQTSEMNGVETSGGSEEPEDITEMFEIISNISTPIK
ncbi:Uncharacterized protein DBV15_09474 [Temnothorax longispinosus]|uniref:DUF4773 domain-containing protein n=1 Tax=Temnothorax longispinosus TaxID=300112 RepID=A0A4S2KJZ0_9HYME|nr:Uncharacterized protein DBV15_09474 [Temnothorax longispinosus]